MIKLDDLLKVSYLKTGRLFEASAKTGAMLAKKSNEEIKSFGLLGKALGTAFEIQDDILDYASLKLNTGTPALKDFKEGKITFPLYFALQNVDSKEKKFLLAKLGKQKITSKDQNKIYELIHNDKTQKQINALFDIVWEQANISYDLSIMRTRLNKCTDLRNQYFHHRSENVDNEYLKESWSIIKRVIK